MPSTEEVDLVCFVLVAPRFLAQVCSEVSTLPAFLLENVQRHDRTTATLEKKSLVTIPAP